MKKTAIITLVAAASLSLAGGAFAATPQQIYRDAADGKLNRQYAPADLRRAAHNATLSGYPSGMPITYVNMTQDVPVPPALADQMAANLGPNVERRTIDAGHSVMVSQPDALAAMVNDLATR